MSLLSASFSIANSFHTGLAEEAGPGGAHRLNPTPYKQPDHPVSLGLIGALEFLTGRSIPLCLANAQTAYMTTQKHYPLGPIAWLSASFEIHYTALI